MKKICAFVLCILFNIGNANASLLYTFEGYIDEFGLDKASEARDAGLSKYSPVSYTLEIDFAGTGSRTRQDGTIEYLSDTSGYYYGAYSNDYFFATLVSSSHPLLSAFRQLQSDDYADFNQGVSIIMTYSNAGELQVADHLMIQSQHRTVHDWVIGEAVQGFYQYGDEATSTDSIFGTSLILTDISRNEVPLPATLYLFGLGLIGLIMEAKQKVCSINVS